MGTRMLGIGLALLGLHAWGGEPMQIDKDDSALTVQRDGHAVLRYAYGHVTFKPYVQELFAPDGRNVARDNVADHIHHHGLMFALAADDIDFWSETEKCGHQRHRGFDDVGVTKRDGVPWAHFTERIDWTGPNSDDALLHETRTIAVPYVEGLPATVVTWESTLEVPQGKEAVTLSGSHYFGLGMRFPKTMDAIGKFFNAEQRDGEIVRGEERNTPATWCAYTAAPEGKPATVAMFGHPDNVRHPTVWFTMPVPFAYMSATLNLCEEPLKLEAGKPLALKYAVVVWDKEVAPEAIGQVYQRWLGWAGGKQ